MRKYLLVGCAGLFFLFLCVFKLPLFSQSENLPDLVIEDEDISMDVDEDAGEMEITAVIRNEGAATAKDIDVIFTVNMAGQAVPLEITVDEIQPDEKKEVSSGAMTVGDIKTFSQTPPSITVSVDPRNDIPEEDESNNVAEYTPEAVSTTPAPTATIMTTTPTMSVNTVQMASVKDPFEKMNVYYGNLHSHTQYSDSVNAHTLHPCDDNEETRNPYNALWAAQNRGLNFMATTDHGGHLEGWEWDETAKQIKKANADFASKPFVALRGFEWTNTGGNVKKKYYNDWIDNAASTSGIGHINIFLSKGYTDIKPMYRTAVELGCCAVLTPSGFEPYRYPYYYKDLDNKFRYHECADSKGKEGELSSATDSLKGIYKWILKSNGAIAQFNHASIYDITSHFENFMHPLGLDFTKVQSKKIISKFALIELGSHTKLQKGFDYEGGGDGTNKDRDNEYWYRLALANGWKVAPVNNEDNHEGNYGGESYGVLVFRTGVWVEGNLTKDKFIGALRQRRVFSSEDENAWVKFSASAGKKTVLMGSSLKPVNKKVTLTIQVQDTPNSCEKQLKENGVNYTPKPKVKYLEVVEIKKDGEPKAQPSWIVAQDKEQYVSVTKEFPVDENTVGFYVRVRLSINNPPVKTTCGNCDGKECWRSMYSAPIWISRDSAKLVKQEITPERTKIVPGTGFTKTWTLKNTGISTWDKNYCLVFAGGKKLGGDDSMCLNKKIKPGEEYAFKMNFKAPKDDGTYKGKWRMQNERGYFFGDTVAVKIQFTDADRAIAWGIKVSDNQNKNYTFSTNSCANFPPTPSESGGDWRCWCQKFVDNTYRYGAKRDLTAFPSAKDAENALNKNRKDTPKHLWTNAPAGAFLFFDLSGYGHVGLYMGGGKMIHAHWENGVIIENVDKYSTYYLGWGMPDFK